jgi:hypothetical protein
MNKKSIDNFDLSYYLQRYNNLNIKTIEDASNHWMNIGKFNGYFKNALDEKHAIQLKNFNKEYYYRKYSHLGIKSVDECINFWKQNGMKLNHFVNFCEEMNEHNKLLCKCKIKSKYIEPNNSYNNVCKNLPDTFLSYSDMDNVSNMTEFKELTGLTGLTGLTNITDLKILNSKDQLFDDSCESTYITNSNMDISCGISRNDLVTRTSISTHLQPDTLSENGDSHSNLINKYKKNCDDNKIKFDSNKEILDNNKTILNNERIKLQNEQVKLQNDKTKLENEKIKLENEKYELEKQKNILANINKKYNNNNKISSSTNINSLSSEDVNKVDHMIYKNVNNIFHKTKCIDRKYIDMAKIANIVKLSNQNLDNKNLNNKHLDNKHLDNKHLDNKHLDNKHLDNKHLDNKHLDNKHLDNNILNNKNLNNAHLDNNILNNKNVDNKNWDNKNVDNKNWDNKNVDNKNWDNKNWDNKNWDNKNVDNKNKQIMYQNKIIDKSPFIPNQISNIMPTYRPMPEYNPPNLKKNMDVEQNNKQSDKIISKNDSASVSSQPSVKSTKSKLSNVSYIKQNSIDSFEIIVKNINEINKLVNYVQIYLTSIKDYISKIIESLTIISVPITANLIYQSERKKIQYFANELDKTVMTATYNGIRILYHPCEPQLKEIIFPIFLSSERKMNIYVENRLGHDGINFTYIMPKVDLCSLGLKKYKQNLIRSNEIMKYESNPLPYDHFGHKPKYFNDLDSKVKRYWDPDFHFQKLNKALDIITLEEQMINNVVKNIELKKKLYENIQKELLMELDSKK